MFLPSSAYRAFPSYIWNKLKIRGFYLVFSIMPNFWRGLKPWCNTNKSNLTKLPLPYLHFIWIRGKFQCSIRYLEGNCQKYMLIICENLRKKVVGTYLINIIEKWLFFFNNCSSYYNIYILINFRNSCPLVKIPMTKQIL